MSTDARTVTANQARSRILKCFKVKRPVFLWGPPGIGKSELVEGITNDLGGALYDLRMPLLEPTDLRGIPFYNKDTGQMDWAPPIDLPTEADAAKYPIVVLFLDEMNSAAPSVQAAGYQLILNRRVGKYKLPDNVVIIAAGNRESDKGVTYRMPAPLSNRFLHLEVRVDHESWEEWAVNAGEHPDVVGYVGFAKQDLYNFDPRSSSRSFATPRTWHFVSELLKDGDCSTSELTDLISGCVGEGTAIKFMKHREISGELPNPTDVLMGKVKTMTIKEISAMYSLTISMCYELKALHEKSKEDKDIDWNKSADNFLKFMMDNFTVELVVMGARVALTTYGLPMTPSKLPSFAEFHKRFGKYIVAAAETQRA
jgi:hypothetical protein